MTYDINKVLPKIQTVSDKYIVGLTDKWFQDTHAQVTWKEYVPQAQ